MQPVAHFFKGKELVLIIPEAGQTPDQAIDETVAKHGVDRSAVIMGPPPKAESPPKTETAPATGTGPKTEKPTETPKAANPPAPTPGRASRWLELAKFTAGQNK